MKLWLWKHTPNQTLLKHSTCRHYSYMYPNYEVYVAFAPLRVSLNLCCICWLPKEINMHGLFVRKEVIWVVKRCRFTWLLIPDNMSGANGKSNQNDEPELVCKFFVYIIAYICHRILIMFFVGCGSYPFMSPDCLSSGETDHLTTHLSVCYDIPGGAASNATDARTGWGLPKI